MQSTKKSTKTLKSSKRIQFDQLEISSNLNLIKINQPKKRFHIQKTTANIYWTKTALIILNNILR